jgi:hypothetical protein
MLGAPVPRVFIVTIRRSVRSEPEAYYMPAPSPAVAEARVRRVAKAPQAVVISVATENGLDAKNRVHSDASGPLDAA